jgi:heme exporter protein B
MSARRAGVVRATLAVFGRELLLSWRDPGHVSSLFFFGFSLLLLFAFAMPDTSVLPDVAGGALWLGLLLASARSLDHSFHVELEHGALEGMVLWPVDPVAIFYGKALANTVILLAVGAAMLPLVVVLYHPVLQGPGWQLAAVLLMGAGAIAAPGTLVSALTSTVRGQAALLPMLLLPLVVPVVLAASRATTLLFEGDVMDQVDDWLLLLLVFNAAHWSLDALLFTRLVDEG